MLLNKFEDFNLIFAFIYVHNIVYTSNNTLLNNLMTVYYIQSNVSFIEVLLLLASITKSAQVLFSVWLPDAIERPTPVSALLHSSTMVTARYILITKYHSITMVNDIFCDLILYISVVTYFSGVAKTTVCKDSKGSIAYSTVAQIRNLFISSVLLP